MKLPLQKTHPERPFPKWSNSSAQLRSFRVNLKTHTEYIFQQFTKYFKNTKSNNWVLNITMQVRWKILRYILFYGGSVMNSETKLTATHRHFFKLWNWKEKDRSMEWVLRPIDSWALLTTNIEKWRYFQLCYRHITLQINLIWLDSRLIGFLFIHSISRVQHKTIF